MTEKRKRKLAMPDTLIIVASVVLLVAILYSLMDHSIWNL